MKVYAWIDAKTKAALDREAERDNRTRSGVIALAIRDYLTKQGKRRKR